MITENNIELKWNAENLKELREMKGKVSFAKFTGRGDSTKIELSQLKNITLCDEDENTYIDTFDANEFLEMLILWYSEKVANGNKKNVA